MLKISKSGRIYTSPSSLQELLSELTKPKLTIRHIVIDVIKRKFDCCVIDKPNSKYHIFITCCPILLFTTFSSPIRLPVDLKHGQEKETCERQSQAIMDTNICSHLRRHFSCFLCLSADWKMPTMDSQNVLTI